MGNPRGWTTNQIVEFMRDCGVEDDSYEGSGTRGLYHALLWSAAEGDSVPLLVSLRSQKLQPINS